MLATNQIKTLKNKIHGFLRKQSSFSETSCRNQFGSLFYQRYLFLVILALWFCDEKNNWYLPWIILYFWLAGQRPLALAVRKTRGKRTHLVSAQERELHCWGFCLYWVLCYPQNLEQCQAGSRCSMNTYWLNKENTYLAPEEPGRCQTLGWFWLWQHQSQNQTHHCKWKQNG